MPASPSQIRKIATGGYTGDAWAVPATLAYPPGSVPVLVADASQVAWQVRAMDGDGDDAQQVAETDLVCDTAVILLDGRAVARHDPITGATADYELVDDDVRPGDRFVLAITAVTVPAAAPWIWIVPIRGMSRAEL